jgi:hypothetical protein
MRQIGVFAFQALGAMLGLTYLTLGALQLLR